MASNNLGSVWSSMRTIVGHQNPKSSSRIILNGFNSDIESSNAFNVFYNRFDTVDFSNTTQEPEDMLVDTQHFKIEQKEVEKAFLKIKVNKSHGPDKICGRLLKSCAVQLSHVFNSIFNLSLKEQHVPEIWKDAVIVSYLVALTSNLMKTFEKMVRTELLRKTECMLDPLQFAYRPHRGLYLIKFSVIWRDPDQMPGFYLLTSIQLLIPSSPIF